MTEPRFTAGPGDREHKRRGEQAEEQRADRQQRDLGRKEDQDQHRAKTRAAGHADDVRRGKRVVQRALKQRPGDAERRADDDRLDGARQAQVEHDLLSVSAPELTAEQRVEHVAEGDAHRAECERGDERRGERDEQPDYDGGPTRHSR